MIIISWYVILNSAVLKQLRSNTIMRSSDYFLKKDVKAQTEKDPWARWKAQTV